MGHEWKNGACGAEPRKLHFTRQLNNGGLRKITVLDYEFTRNSYLVYHKDKSFGAVKKEIFDFCYKNYKYMHK